MEKYILCSVLLLHISGAASAASAASLVSGALGGSVRFNVSVPSEANGLIIWTFKNAPAAQLNPGLPPLCFTPFVGRCNVYSNGSLTLDSITYTDEGDYGMNAYNTTGGVVRTETYQLRVYDTLTKPVLRSNDTSSPLIGGTYVTLHCDAGNQTVTTYTFYRDEKTICSEPHVTCRGPYLDFTPINETDSGSYTCSIQNPVSSSTSERLSLTVYAPVSDVWVTSNVSGLVWPGIDSVSLRCSAAGTDVSYSWSLQGAPISGGGRFHLTENNTALTISPVLSDDNGSFICTATNALSSQNSSDVKMDLASRVSEVSLKSSHNTSGALWAGQDSVSLNCSAQGSDIAFSWSLNGHPVYPNITDPTLTLHPIKKSDNGNFTCTATNRLNKETSNEINLDINWSPDRNILCTAEPIDRTNAQLGCSWSGGKPAATVTMIFNNTQDTSPNEVYRNVMSGSNIQGSNLTCHGDQLGTTESCVLPLGPPNSPSHPNNTITKVTEGGTVTLTVSLISGARVRAGSSSSQALPAAFFWYRGPSREPIQTGGPFSVISSDYTSNLTINTVSKAEAGTYECRAENFIGSTTFIFNVEVSQEGVSSNGLNGGEIAGIVIGVLAGVALIGVIVFFVLKKKKRSNVNKRLEEPDDQTGIAVYAKVNKNRATNGGTAETEISNNAQDNTDELQYAKLSFPNSSSTKTTTPPTATETLYSDVKLSTKR